MEPNNFDRARWAAEAIETFASVCRMDGEDDETKAKDLVSDIVHFLRLSCALSFEDAAGVIQSAVDMAEMETNEDSDDDNGN